MDSKEIKPVNPKGNQPWIFIGRTDTEAEALIFWPPDAKSWLIGKDPDAWKDRGHEEKGVTGDKVVGWHHQLSEYAAAAAKSLQSYPTLCDPIDGSPLGSSVPGILQARILECVAISFSNAWKSKVKVKSLSHARLLATPWTAAYQAPPSMGFSRQEYQSGVPLPSLSVNISFSKLWEIVKDREVWHTVVHGVAKSTTELSNWIATMSLNYVIYKMRMVKILWGLDKTKCANLGSW